MTQETNPSKASTHPQRVPFLRRLLTNRRLWAILIVVLGLWLMFFFGTRTLRAYRELEYAREQGLLNGTASVDAIQPWMNIRYIAVAYAVPEEYIYAKLEIPFDRRSERDPIGRIGRQRRDEESPPSETTKVPPANPQAARNAAVQQMREIILAYRENPVAPGLRDIRPWMSLAYIANSTGVPLDYLLDSLATTAQMVQATETAGRDSPPPPDMLSELAGEEAPYKPLDLLSDELHYPGGPEGLLNAVRDALDTYTDEPAQE
ncbi:MAG TPA: hypothetical protein P5121_07235 [Caldilineaceae bacterium]|nr:hypothetical protein [Caldilineaceae bacterium]